MSASRTNTLEIRTPEGISFMLELAGPVTRFFAWAVDLACISVISSVLSTAAFFLGFLNADLAMAATVLVYFAVSIGYGMLLEWIWRGQTLGKRLLRLRVVDEHGLSLQFNQVAVRNLLRFVDSMPALYLVGGIAVLMSRRAQRLGDYAANTVVIRTRAEVEEDYGRIGAGKYNSFHEYPHLEARLRRLVSPGETAMALQALRRRDELDPEARLELFRDMAAHFRALAAFPEDAVFGLTDEQYVRNVVLSVFQAGKPEPSSSRGKANG